MAPSAWTTRPIDAPAGDMLTLAEVARLFGQSEDTFRRLIADGEFPDGLRVRGQGKVWDWQSITYYRLRLAMDARFLRPQRDANGRNRPQTGGNQTQPDGE